MSVKPRPQLTFDAWLEEERARHDGKTQYVHGEVFAMAGGLESHNLISANLVREIGNGCKGKPCRVYGSDMRVYASAADACFYPDVSVVCGEREFHDDRRDVITNPVLVVEVLSDATEAYDRGDKFRDYRTLPSLHAYLLDLAQHMHRSAGEGPEASGAGGRD